MPTTTAEQRGEAREGLREMLPPGSVVHTALRHVSRSGMMRAIGCYRLGEQDAAWLSYRVATATGYPFSEKYEAVRADGCGMDMGFAVVYDLARALYPDGFGCVGEGCPSNDHPNGDRDYTPHGHRKAVHVPNDPDALRHWHQDGGYALRQRWL